MKKKISKLSLATSTVKKTQNPCILQKSQSAPMTSQSRSHPPTNPSSEEHRKHPRLSHGQSGEGHPPPCCRSREEGWGRARFCMGESAGTATHQPRLKDLALSLVQGVVQGTRQGAWPLICISPENAPGAVLTLSASLAVAWAEHAQPVRSRSERLLEEQRVDGTWARTAAPSAALSCTGLGRLRFEILQKPRSSLVPRERGGCPSKELIREACFSTLHVLHSQPKGRYYGGRLVDSPS